MNLINEKVFREISVILNIFYLYTMDLKYISLNFGTLNLIKFYYYYFLSNINYKKGLI